MQNTATSLSCIRELYYIFTAKANLSWGRVVLCRSWGTDARNAYAPTSAISQTGKPQALAHAVELGAGQLYMLLQESSGRLDAALLLPFGQGR